MVSRVTLHMKHCFFIHIFPIIGSCVCIFILITHLSTQRSSVMAVFYFLFKNFFETILIVTLWYIPSLSFRVPSTTSLYRYLFQNADNLSILVLYLTLNSPFVQRKEKKIRHFVLFFSSLSKYSQERKK